MISNLQWGYVLYKTILIFALILLVNSCVYFKNDSEKENIVSEKKAPSLINTRWQLVSINGQEVKNIDGNPLDFFIELKDSDNSFSGFFGCNIINGSYHTVSSHLHFHNIATTKRFCQFMKWEELMLNFLNEADAFDLSRNNLILLTKNKKKAVFTNSETN